MKYSAIRVDPGEHYSSNDATVECWKQIEENVDLYMLLHFSNIV